VSDFEAEAVAETVEQQLVAAGLSPDEIAEARRTGQLALLVVSKTALGGEPRYTTEEVAERAGLPAELSRRLWRGLGFPDVDPTEKAFTDADVEALSTVNTMIQVGLTDPDVMLQLTRVVGSSMARVAEAQLSAAATGRQAPHLGELAAVGAGAALDTQARLLEYVWRRHMQAAALRRLVEPSSGAPSLDLAIGFADLVGFTALSQELDEHELARVVSRFEVLAYDAIAARGGRVAKMIGDEVMFAVGKVDAAVEIGLALAEAYAEDELLSDVRVGIAAGPVLVRDADYYGPVVNTASRIVNIALPGSVVVSDEVHAALAGDSRFVWKSLRPRTLKDIGRVALWTVRSPGEDPDDRRVRRRQRREERRQAGEHALRTLRRLAEGDGRIV
jgi:adenylate cyclase